MKRYFATMGGSYSTSAERYIGMYLQERYERTIIPEDIVRTIKNQAEREHDRFLLLNRSARPCKITCTKDSPYVIRIHAGGVYLTLTEVRCEIVPRE